MMKICEYLFRRDWGEKVLFWPKNKYRLVIANHKGSNNYLDFFHMVVIMLTVTKDCKSCFMCLKNFGGQFSFLDCRLSKWLPTFGWPPAGGCPAPCSCFSLNGLKTYDCYNMKLTSIPTNIPIDTERLKLSDNNIASIGKNIIRP